MPFLLYLQKNQAVSDTVDAIGLIKISLLLQMNAFENAQKKWQGSASKPAQKLLLAHIL